MSLDLRRVQLHLILAWQIPIGFVLKIKHFHRHSRHLILFVSRQLGIKVQERIQLEAKHLHRSVIWPAQIKR